LKNLINKLFKIPGKQAITPSVPKGIRIYCIGDIHGCHDLLIKLINAIELDAQDYPDRVLLIYLGDFIDRGTSSKEVIDFIINYQNNRFESIFIRGNHEQTLLDFFNEDTMDKAWFSFGGMATLASYGVRINKIPTRHEDFLYLQQQLSNLLPVNHYQFLKETRLSYSIGSYFFVHAGINPHQALNDQYAEDLMWIRDEFINYKKPFEKIIVHGHTVTTKPEILPNRIGIDTGAYMSGILSCVVLETNQQRIIHT
jgi:serine/threonine protein phosphatase 1